MSKEYKSTIPGIYTEGHRPWTDWDMPDFESLPKVDSSQFGTDTCNTYESSISTCAHEAKCVYKVNTVPEIITGQVIVAGIIVTTTVYIGLPLMVIGLIIGVLL